MLARPFTSFHKVTHKLRDFFDRLGYVEVHTQDRLSILAACEDPSTITKYKYLGKSWPLPQTGQMWLEWELLSNWKEVNGVYCLSTSYRQEPNPVPGRHNVIFPMFEFEGKGDMRNLINTQRNLLEHLGYGESSSFPERTYQEMADKYGAEELDHDHERLISQEYGPAFFLTNFPEHTSPFWNMMRRDGGISDKVDVILSGMEVLGSASRSCDKEEMKRRFLGISEGEYAKLLYEQFSEERVNKELNDFLALDFKPRFGCGVGVTRLMKSMEEEKLL